MPAVLEGYQALILLSIASGSAEQRELAIPGEKAWALRIAFSPLFPALIVPTDHRALA
jgi:hypothetical protein